MDSRITQLENVYASLWYYPDEAIIHHKILQPIAGDEFRNLLLTGLRTFKEHSAQKWLSDDREQSFFNAEDSAWAQDYWLPLAIKAGWKHWAMLPPENARGKVNIKRLMDYVAERYRINTKLFSDPDEALEWLIDQGKNQI
jgi:hypothetical protein